MRVVRSYWKDWPEGSTTFSQIPEVPPFNDIIFVYGEGAKEDIPELERRGYDVRHIDEPHFNRDGYAYGRKLITLELGVLEFGNVLMLDWDCVPTRDIDLEELEQKLKGFDIQVPVYGHPNQRYSYIYEEGHYISPNFGFVYCENLEVAHRLLEIAMTKDLDTCVEEHAMFLYAIENTIKTWGAYILWYAPTVCHGVNPGHYVGEQAETENGIIQLKTIELVNDNLEMDIYFKHV